MRDILGHGQEHVPNDTIKNNENMAEAKKIENEYISWIQNKVTRLP